MSLERNNTALEFESMLRRHIRRNGAAVEPCSGLDADLASAYLEGALAGNSLHAFQTHLADCRDCRGQLIGLSRLGPVSAAPIGRPVSAPTSWERLQNAAAGLLGQIEGAGWRWNWTMASGALAACVVFAAMLVLQPWRDSAPSQVRGGSDLALGAGDSQTVESAPGQAVFAENELPAEVSPESPAQVRNRIPRPSIDSTSVTIRQSASGLLSTELRALTASSSSLPPVPNTQSIEPPVSSAPLGEFIPTRASAQSLAAAPVAYSDRRQASDSERPEIAPRINPLPDYNPMHSVSDAGRRSSSRTRNEKSSLRVARPGWTDRVMGFMPVTQPESRRSSGETADEDLPAPLTRKLRDKVFRYENGIWVDQAYKPEMMYWRVIRIDTGSRDYEKLVADDPQIREFLNLDRVIIVWRDKIYRIVKR